jgi:hypothetical protein
MTHFLLLMFSKMSAPLRSTFGRRRRTCSFCRAQQGGWYETTLRASPFRKAPYLPGMLGTGAELQGQALEYTQTQKSPDASPGLSR